MCDALRYLVPFVQFKKHEKHSLFVNCTNGTKWHKALILYFELHKTKIIEWSWSSVIILNFDDSDINFQSTKHANT